MEDEDREDRKAMDAIRSLLSGGSVGVVVVWCNENELVLYHCQDFGQIQELLDHAKKAGTLH